MSELTSTAKKIMEIYRYFRLKRDEYLSDKLIESKRHLWQDVEEEEFTQAMSELVEKGFIRERDNRYGWRLLEAGEDYLKQTAR